MSECKPNWWGRETHCFEARYDSLQPQSPEFITPIIATIMFSEDKVAAIEHMRSEVYITMSAPAAEKLSIALYWRRNNLIMEERGLSGPLAAVRPGSHPVQLHPHPHPHYGAQVNADVVRAAYEVYCHVYAPQEAMVTGGCRGGFGLTELVGFLYARSFPKAEWEARFREACRDMKGF